MLCKFFQNSFNGVAMFLATGVAYFYSLHISDVKRNIVNWVKFSSYSKRGHVLHFLQSPVLLDCPFFEIFPLTVYFGFSLQYATESLTGKFSYLSKLTVYTEKLGASRT